MEYNVYDFDKTIYCGDSTIDFYIFCLKKHPQILMKLPLAIFGLLLYRMNRCSKTEFKEFFFSFLKKIPNVILESEIFWSVHSHKVAQWYKNQHFKTDIIISASPEFLLRPICNVLGVECLIASIVDIKSGKFIGENCYGKEKAIRLQRQLDDLVINEFYSDSLSDLPLALLAKKSFLVERSTIRKWL